MNKELITNCIVTAYLYTGHLAANGHYPSVHGHTIAASDRSIPLGTMVTINGLGTYTVTDHMNKRYNGQERFDVYYGHDRLGAKDFGCQHHNITLCSPSSH